MQNILYQTRLFQQILLSTLMVYLTKKFVTLERKIKHNYLFFFVHGKQTCPLRYWKFTQRLKRKHFITEIILFFINNSVIIFWNIKHKSQWLIEIKLNMKEIKIIIKKMFMIMSFEN